MPEHRHRDCDAASAQAAHRGPPRLHAHEYIYAPWAARAYPSPGVSHAVPCTLFGLALLSTASREPTGPHVGACMGPAGFARVSCAACLVGTRYARGSRRPSRHGSPHGRARRTTLASHPRSPTRAAARGASSAATATSPLTATRRASAAAVPGHAWPRARRSHAPRRSCGLHSYGHLCAIGTALTLCAATPQEACGFAFLWPCRVGAVCSQAVTWSRLVVAARTCAVTDQVEWSGLCSQSWLSRGFMPPIWAWLGADSPLVPGTVKRATTGVVGGASPSLIKVTTSVPYSRRPSPQWLRAGAAVAWRHRVVR